ncbi:hypothetical protein V8E51_003018 [Hyaloscypha variabilis]
MREALGEKKKPPALMDFLVRQRAFVRMQEEFVIDKLYILVATDKVSKALKRAEVKNRNDIYNWKGTTKYGNRDLYPITPPEHTFGYLAYFAFWNNSGTSITSFTPGSSYIAIDLNASETVVACFLESVISFVIDIFGTHPDKSILLDTYALHTFKVSRIEADAGGFSLRCIAALVHRNDALPAWIRHELH